jgi:cytoskeleton protein RodZ
MSVTEPSPAELSPGTVLRQARERAGLSLEDVAQRTLVPLSRLRALENDDYERVGVPTFVLGYTRSYARFLKVDPAPLLKNLEATLPRVDPVPVQTSTVALALQVQRKPRSYFWPTVLFVVLVLGAIAFIGINTSSLVSPSSNTPAQVQVVPATTSDGRTLSLPLSVTVEPEAATPAELLPLDNAAGEGESEPEAALDDDDFNPTQASGLEEPEQEEQSLSAPAAATDVLTLTFIADCWVSVTDATGKALIARLATSRDNLQLFGRAPFEVVLGDATAVNSVTINGRVVDAAPRGDRKSRRLTVGP